MTEGFGHALLGPASNGPRGRDVDIARRENQPISTSSGSGWGLTVATIPVPRFSRHLRKKEENTISFGFLPSQVSGPLTPQKIKRSSRSPSIPTAGSDGRHHRLPNGMHSTVVKWQFHFYEKVIHDRLSMNRLLLRQEKLKLAN